MTKSSRHSKLTGDWAEAFVLYWLSKEGYECARLDHVGIDLIVGGAERMGVQVKGRSRTKETGRTPLNLPVSGFTKASKACRDFGVIPYYAIVVDTADRLTCFLLSLKHLKTLVGGQGDIRFWKMGDKDVERYRRDPDIKMVEFLDVTSGR